MKLLWVTSFAPDMYRATGQRLLQSFLESESTGDLLLCAEQGAGSEHNLPRIRRHDLDKSRLLREWLAANRDIIPAELGGGAGPCGCGALDTFRGHRSGCTGVWWNKNASRWFRKVVSVRHATRLPGYDAVVWLDSDCEFRKRVDAATVGEWFGPAGVFILKSKDRAVVESGVMGYRGPDGRRFVRLVMERFRTGEFRNDPRWDDGYQFQRVLDLHPEIARNDIARHVTGNMHVLQNSPAGEYLAHNKGIHGRSRVMS